MIDDYRRYINRDLPLIERGCTSKVPYESRREARSYAKHGHSSRGSLEAYHCRYFEHWHLGHRRSAHR